MYIKPDFDPCAPTLFCKFWGPGTTSHYVLHSNCYGIDPGFVGCSAPTSFTLAKQSGNSTHTYDNGASFQPSHGPPQMVGTIFGEILGFSASSSVAFRVELNFTRSICVFLTYIIWWYRQWSTMQFLNTNYKDIVKFVKFGVTVLKHQEALETNFYQNFWRVLVKAAVGHVLDRIWSLSCKKIYSHSEWLPTAFQKTWQYTYSFVHFSYYYSCLSYSCSFSYLMGVSGKLFLSQPMSFAFCSSNWRWGEGSMGGFF